MKLNLSGLAFIRLLSNHCIAVSHAFLRPQSINCLKVFVHNAHCIAVSIVTWCVQLAEHYQQVVYEYVTETVPFLTTLEDINMATCNCTC